MDIYTQFNGRIFIFEKEFRDENMSRGWSTCGEHVQPNEDFLQGALRGIKEELGIHLQPTQLKQKTKQPISISLDYFEGDPIVRTPQESVALLKQGKKIRRKDRMFVQMFSFEWNGSLDNLILEDETIEVNFFSEEKLKKSYEERPQDFCADQFGFFIKSD